MAWNLTLQDASFRGVTFEVQSVEDRGEKALCVHEYPYRSGAEVEDLGRKPRVIPVTAIFWGVAYESRIKALVAAFEEAGPGELIHPVFGSLTVAVRRWQIQHSAERHDYATVTFEAVEAVTDNPFFGATSSRSLAEQALADISSSLDEALGLSESELGKTLGQWADTAANIKARVETELQGVLDVLDAGRGVVRSVLSYVDVPAAFVADAQAIVRGLQADAASASSSVVSAFGVLSTALPLVSLTAPEAVKAYATGAGAYGPAVATIPVPDAGSVQTPQGVAVTHVTLLEAQATAQAASEALKADMASPALTPGEIEGLAGNVRARLDDALHYTAAALPQGSVHPVCERLRTASRAMQQLAEAALNARPPLAIRTAGLACNFHLLAHRLYGDFTRADELRRINPQVRNPNFIDPNQELLVYVR